MYSIISTTMYHRWPVSKFWVRNKFRNKLSPKFFSQQKFRKFRKSRISKKSIFSKQAFFKQQGFFLDQISSYFNSQVHRGCLVVIREKSNSLQQINVCMNTFLTNLFSFISHENQGKIQTITNLHSYQTNLEQICQNFFINAITQLQLKFHKISGGFNLKVISCVWIYQYVQMIILPNFQAQVFFKISLLM
eukprot:TRINITY_DN7129_c0_g1_i8.p1 TRINITY_DN7129_c0_g1~~TRINITY_DN7129_c0_g1_i8.p1  ORF type:complete len:191 (-),score=-17.08 TRINITY_DN7129_c0_g1_i8:180-752(-)